jgi:catechol 2,3-dioxygenase-like lactoylglutathione lyase family enzyme
MKNKGYIISGIQQMGVGVSDLTEAWEWYIKAFGMDCRIFEDEAEARLMLPYTDGEPRSRHAVLAMNLQSGGGFEVWQHKGKKPEYRDRETKLGDLGIFACKMKVKDVESAWKYWTDNGVTVLGKPVADPAGRKNFFVRDPFGNLFHIVEATDWFMNLKKISGGAYGAVIGVSDIDRALRLYSGILGYDRVVYDVTGTFDDLSPVPGGSNRFRRVLLAPARPFHGGFNPLFGQSVIELVQVLDRDATRIFEGRLWGDPGFIHLCYDINGMDNLRKYCSEAGFPFTVDSKESHEGNSFDMGEAAGHFAYIEDPDGTLIEFVETHKVPIIKKLGWYLDMRRRDPNKPLPSWMIKSLRFSRVKGRNQARGKRQ